MDRPALPLGELLCYFYLSLSSGKGQVQVSTPPSLASCTLCLLLCKIPFSCLKRGQKRACNALEEQTSTGSRHSSTRTLSKDLPCCCSVPGSCTHSPLPCSLHSPISSGPDLTSRCICWCHLRPQILPDRKAVCRQRSSPCLCPHVRGHLPLQAKAATAAARCCTPAVWGNALIK